jgi:hypothetical protein
VPRNTASPRGKRARSTTVRRDSTANGSAGADGSRSERFRDPLNGGTLRVDRFAGSARVLIVHEQNGGYSRDELAALAESASAPSLGEFFNDPSRWLAPFAIAPSYRRAKRVPLPAVEQVDAWARALFGGDGREARRWLLRERGVSREVMKANRIGWDGARLVFPLWMDGQLVNVKTRVPRPKPTRTYDWPGGGLPYPLYPEPDPTWPWALVVAGEFDALAGRSAGLPATSVTNGAGNWKPHWTDRLRGRRVLVCFDNNEVEQSRAVVGRLRSAGLRAQRLDLRALGLTSEKGDLNEYLTGGGDPSAIERAACSRRIVRPKKTRSAA